MATPARALAPAAARGVVAARVPLPGLAAIPGSAAGETEEGVSSFEGQAEDVAENDWVQKQFDDEGRSEEILDQLRDMRGEEELDESAAVPEVPSAEAVTQGAATGMPKEPSASKPKQKASSTASGKVGKKKTNWKKLLFSNEMTPEQVLDELPELASGPELPGKGLSFNKGPHLMGTVASGNFQGGPGRYQIELPTTWVDKFKKESVLLSRGASDPVLMAGMAQLKGWRGREVQFMVLHKDSPETARELEMLRRLAGYGVVPHVIDKVEHPEGTYVLVEPFDMSLQRLLESQLSVDGMLPGQHTHLSLYKAVPLMADLLMAAVAMESAKVRHGDLSEETIFCVDRCDHAVIADFHASCLLGDDVGDFGCDAAKPESVWRQAPETRPGQPADAAASHVWQLGLVFARMLFGGRPLAVQAVERQFPYNRFDDHTEEGRETIRQAVREALVLDKLPGYNRMRQQYPDVMKLVEGMLQKDPAERWSALEALRFLEKVADAEGLRIPPPRQARVIEKKWHIAWNK